MALRTNTKQARKNIVNYILEDMDYIKERAEYDNIEINEDDTNRTLAYIYNIFWEEVGNWTVKNLRKTTFEAFKDWAQGLAMGGLFCYYYNIDAVELLGDILEETEAERNKYNQEQAENMLTYLIYRECEKAYKKEA